MMIAREYHNLESKVYSSRKIKLKFKKGDKIRLERGIEEGKYVVLLTMPWGNLYTLGEYESEEKAKNAFQKYDSILKKGGLIRIDERYSAKILEEKV